MQMIDFYSEKSVFIRKKKKKKDLYLSIYWNCSNLKFCFLAISRVISFNFSRLLYRGDDWVVDLGYRCSRSTLKHFLILTLHCFKITQLDALGLAFLLEQKNAELFCPKSVTNRLLLQNSKMVIPEPRGLDKLCAMGH